MLHLSHYIIVWSEHHLYFLSCSTCLPDASRDSTILIYLIEFCNMGFPDISVTNPPAMQETPVRFLSREDPLENRQANPLQCSWASLVAELVKNPPAMREAWVRSLEKRKATYSSILAWRIPWNHKESDVTKRLSLSHVM